MSWYLLGDRFFSAIGQELCRPHLTRADTLVFQDGVEGASQQI